MLLIRMTVEEVGIPTPQDLLDLRHEPPEGEPPIQKHLPYEELNFKLELLLLELDQYE